MLKRSRQANKTSCQHLPLVPCAEGPKLTGSTRAKLPPHTKATSPSSCTCIRGSVSKALGRRRETS